MKERAKETAKNAGVLLVVGILYYLFYRLTDIGFKCPLYELFGILCPGCGLTRMITSLLSFDLKGALYYNAAVLILIPLLLAVGISYYYEYIKNGVRSLKRWHKAALIFSAAIMLAYGILRNAFEIGLHPSHGEMLGFLIY